MTDKIFVGRRKNAVARVYLRNGSGKVTVNDKEVEVYFTKLMLKTLRGCIHITVFCTRITDTSFYL